MIGVIVNTLAVVFGSFIGLLCKKGIPERLSKAVMSAIGLCVVLIGISGSIKTQNVLVVIVSMVFGTILGTLIDLDAAITRLGDAVSRKFQKSSGGNVTLAEGFVTASLLFCVGAMAIVGSLNAGLRGDNEMLFTKSLLDMISACMLSVSLGLGVTLSGAMVFIYQGAIVLLAQVIAPILSDTAITEMSAVGSLLIVAIGLNMLGITKLKVANYLPAVFLVPLFTWLIGMLPL